MPNITKFVVIDNAGCEHIFCEEPGVVEYVIDMDSSEIKIPKNTITIKEYCYENGILARKNEVYFPGARRIDLIEMDDD